MNWELIPVVGDFLARTWAPVLENFNEVLEHTGLLNPTITAPNLMLAALLLMWLLIRMRRWKIKFDRYLRGGAAVDVDEDEDEQDEDGGDSIEDIEAAFDDVDENAFPGEVAIDEPRPLPMEEEDERAPELAPAESVEDVLGAVGKARAEAVESLPADDEAVEELPEPEEEEEEEEEAPPVEAPRLGLFARLRKGLAKTAGGLVGKIDTILTGRTKIDADLYADLEEALITADIGVNTAYKLLEGTQRLVNERKITSPDALRALLKEQILDILKTEAIPLDTAAKKPFVIMVVGVNGVGKTTTIGKMAAQFHAQGRKVMMAAGDTFRAAAIEQLEIWAGRVGCEFLKQKQGADPSAVAFDAVQAAVARDIDVVLVDTAGRLHTKSNLMEELKKIKRVMAKIVPDAPHETVLVLDSTTGQNAITQAKTFNEAIDLSGIILTKLDGTSKGGCIVGISDELSVPIRFIGIGEQIDDLRPFDAADFVEALFDEKR